MWSFIMKKYFVTPVVVAIYLNNAHIYFNKSKSYAWYMVIQYEKVTDHGF